jgi:hypothetical protein
VYLTATRKRARRGLDTPLYPGATGCSPCALLRSALLLRGNLAPLSVGERGAGVSRFSGPLPPALLTNAFANPLEVCAAGAIIMTLATFVCNLRHFVVLRCLCPSWTTAGR